MNKLLLAIVASVLMSCFNKVKNDTVANLPETDSVSNVIKLPKQLKEISGITFVNDSIIAAVEDENGVLYFFNLVKQEIVKEFPFAEKGDYEDLARNGDDMYVIRADGIIYEIANFTSEHPQVTFYKTPLKAKHDIEGLAYDKKNDRLLLSVKEKNLEKKDDENDVKNIYQFTLKDKKFHVKPAIQINLKDIDDQFKGDELIEASKDFLKAVGNENHNEIIKPTALTYHPITGELYILSATNKFILVLNDDGTFNRVRRFVGQEFSQPEGIAFNSKGELFISNEGVKKKGNIIKLID